MRPLFVPQMASFYQDSSAYVEHHPITNRIYRAYHVSGKRWHLHKKVQGEKGAYLLGNEYRILRQLKGVANIPNIHGLYYDNQDTVLVRDYVEGQTLSELLQNQITSGERLDECLMVLFDCICDLHKYNIIHADLKPNNILIGSKGVSLIDFAAASHQGEPVANRRYHSYSPSFGHPKLLNQTGCFTETLDWYGYLVIAYIVYFARLPPKYSAPLQTKRTSSYDFSRLLQATSLPTRIHSRLCQAMTSIQ